MIRLNKYISECGVCSRRNADKLIQNMKVQVNGIIQSSLGTKIDEKNDIIKVNGNVITKSNKLIYIKLNKPKGYVTTSKEQFQRKCVLDLLDIDTRVFPIGRLDMYTEGLLLLTNDGDFANKMMHPRNKIEKTYIAKVSGNITEEKLDMLRKGVDIGGYITKEAKVRYLGENKIEIIISEGKNRQVRKMCEKVNLKVLELRREKIGNLSLGNLKVGKYVFLDKKEAYEIIR